jgi:hypothetical protein
MLCATNESNAKILTPRRIVAEVLVLRSGSLLLFSRCSLRFFK